MLQALLLQFFWLIVMVGLSQLIWKRVQSFITIQVGEVAATTTRDADLLADATCMVQHGHPQAAQPQLPGAIQPGTRGVAAAGGGHSLAEGGGLDGLALARLIEARAVAAQGDDHRAGGYI